MQELEAMASANVICWFSSVDDAVRWRRQWYGALVRQYVRGCQLRGPKCRTSKSKGQLRGQGSDVNSPDRDLWRSPNYQEYIECFLCFHVTSSTVDICTCTAHV